ncbi:hypothetical protein FHS29_000314 [Saccharothrix tamanrassetensis]|uniref:SH3 domain-containing protein n=1 Tax=Saccharothrix tamanrassetensis TaxID=1051531 RepID=A0A841CBL0_9PSEU|nr:hypothetical protein [Saccharothrix tamanrassetensis]MBB5953744.1 hypothetical protein [Saccharothrix tamanrassetensis]
MTLAAVAVAGSGVLVAAGTASAAPTVTAGPSVQSLCNTNQNTWVREDSGFTRILYTIPRGGGFRLTGKIEWKAGHNWAQGHGNNDPTGWVPLENLTGCH